MKTFLITMLALLTFTANAQTNKSTQSLTFSGPVTGSSSQEIDVNDADRSASTVNGSQWTLVVVTGTRRVGSGIAYMGVSNQKSFDNIIITKTPGYSFEEACNQAAAQAKARGKFTMDAYCIRSPF